MLDLGLSAYSAAKTAVHLPKSLREPACRNILTPNSFISRHLRANYRHLYENKEFSGWRRIQGVVQSGWMPDRTEWGNSQNGSAVTIADSPTTVAVRAPLPPSWPRLQSAACVRLVAAVARSTPTSESSADLMFTDSF